jgi:serine/threonine protein kinase
MLSVPLQYTKEGNLYRLKLFDTLFDGKIDTDCDDLALKETNKSCTKIFEKLDIKQLKLFDKDSASDTIIVFGNIQKTINSSEYQRDKSGDSSSREDISIKISFASNDNSLKIEIYLYEIINKIIRNNYSPNFIGMIGGFRCNGLVDYLNKMDRLQKNSDNITQFYQDVLNQIDDIEENSLIRYDIDCANILILEKSSGITFTTLLNKYTISENDFFSLLFQILYSLDIIYKMGIQHNDLHPGNIFVELSNGIVFGKVDLNYISPINLYYKVDENYYKIPSKFIAKIYDFDLGAIKGKTNNKIQKDYYCKKLGICNKINPKFDTFTFLSTLYNTFGSRNYIPNEVMKFIERNISEKLLKQKWGYQDRLCKLIKEGECDGPYEPPTFSCGGMNIPREMILNDSIFQKWKISRDKIPTDANVYSYINPDIEYIG